MTHKFSKLVSGAFNNHVQAFIKNGMLTQAQGQALINGANNEMINIGC
ncbi:MAG TPA: hypothetical protein VJ784_08535 [Pyrinomonadaceae bacterium]|jgi:hypothetical protein|nr:hypothetical protein [Pyrinomonadaceae bacterium]